jgi:acyl-CoA synthetase (AMP-forming)/AMP-acid ligase II
MPLTRDEKLPRAWIVLSPSGTSLGAEEALKRLDAWVREQLSRYKWLSGGMEAVDEIPKSATGKVLRRELVDRYVKGRQAGSGDGKKRGGLLGISKL